MGFAGFFLVAWDIVQFARSRDIYCQIRGSGADSAICANPVAATHQQAVEAVRKKGVVVLFGGLPKAAPMTELDANRIHYDEIRVIVFMTPATSPYTRPAGSTTASPTRPATRT